MLKAHVAERKPWLPLIFHLLTRIYLGITDTEVESVFRTTEGLTTPWAKWQPGHPNDAKVDTAVEDCVRRDPSNGRWTDIICGNNLAFYCEGEKTFHLSRHYKNF